MFEKEENLACPEHTESLFVSDDISPKALVDLFLRNLGGATVDVGFSTFAQASSFVLSLAQIVTFADQPGLGLPLSQAIEQNRDLISVHLLDLHKAYERMCDAGHAEGFQQIWGAMHNNEQNHYLRVLTTLPDLYLDLKEKFEAAEPSDGHGQAKITGQEYFRRTQFFTEPYMASFLMEAGLKAFATPIEPDSFPTVIDPACGAGSVLIAALECLAGQLQDLELDDSMDLVFANIVGYDLDPVVASICKAALATAFAGLAKRSSPVAAKIHTESVESGWGFFSLKVVRKLRSEADGNRCLLITNPPFLGRRLMDSELKNFLNAQHPEAMGDLCTAFMMRCSDFLAEGDVLALVHQSTFWHLSSLSKARAEILHRLPLRLSVNLGARAFRHLSGEKATVSLSIFSQAADGSSQPRKYDFSKHDLTVKRALLIKLMAEDPLDDADVATRWELPLELRDSGSYGTWAVPMQGTSTGNSSEAIRYSWEIPEQYTEWVGASKGGGYCRWLGLNRYVVLWGKAGEELRRYPGHALRNVKTMESTALVFSDTGTQGLNVRTRLSGQVFIASGPGIRLIRGDHYAHLAFLNSRFASLVLRKINPKLTIAAGYIKKLPFNEYLSNHEENANLAERCVDAKRAMLSRKLSNDECNLTTIFAQPISDFDAYFRNELLDGLSHERRKLEFEALIEHHVIRAFGFSTDTIEHLRHEMGPAAGELKECTLDIGATEIDLLLNASLSVSVQYKGRSKNRSIFGIDGALESLAYTLDANPNSVFDAIHRHVDLLTAVKSKFLNDLLHKAALFAMGFAHNRCWGDKTLGIGLLRTAMLGVFPGASCALKELACANNLESWIRYLLPQLHAEAFFDHPFLHVTDAEVELTRQVRI